jgi:hypothetical protein
VEQEDIALKLARMMLDTDIAERVYIIDRQRWHAIWDSFLDNERVRDDWNRRI